MQNKLEPGLTKSGRIREIGEGAIVGEIKPGERRDRMRN